MSNEELMENAELAIDAVFNDRSVDVRTAISNMNSLIEYTKTLREALECDDSE